ncbi:MAG: polysaccharide deacetylase family protein [bacterium]
MLTEKLRDAPVQSAWTGPPQEKWGRTPNEFSALRNLVKKIEAHSPLVLIVLASFLTLLFLFFGFWIPQTPGRLARPTASLVDDLEIWRLITSLPLHVSEDSNLIASLLIVVSGCAFFAYGLAIFLSWRNRRNPGIRKVVVCASLLFSFVSVWFLPNFNTDIYNYILRGRVSSVYQSNPYYDAADKFSTDPIYPYASHRYTTRPGGKFPGWMYLNILLSRLAGDEPTTNLLLYRFVLFMFHLVNLALLALILKKVNPEYVFAGLLVYAWNPIVALNSQSKTDTVMVFYLLLAVWLLLTERKRLAVVALGLSTAVKLITGPLMAVYFLRDIRLRRWRTVAENLFVLAATFLILYLPFWRGPELIAQHWESLGEAAAAAPALIKIILPLIFAGLILWVGLSQDGSAGSLLWGWAYLMLFFALFLTKLGLAWYLMTLIALVSLSFGRRLTVVMVILSFSSFLFNVWYSTFSKHFKVEELFSAPQLMVYISLPAVALIFLTGYAVYQSLEHRNRRIRQILAKKAVQHSEESGNGAIYPMYPIYHKNDGNTILRNGKGAHMLRVITYHRVDEPEATPWLDPNLISATPAVFEQHMAFLAKSYDVVAVHDVLDALENGASLPRRAILITFDDAYCDFKVHAWPILRQFDLPATVFVPTAYPDQEQRVFWWDQVYRSVLFTSSVELRSTTLGVISLNTPAERQQSVRRIQRYVKTLSHEQAIALVREICSELGEGPNAGKTVLAWDELRQLAKAGVTFGPHTQTHPIMTQLTPEQMHQEVVGAYDDLKREIGDVPPIFCYPNGGHNDEVVGILRDEGFKLGFTVMDGQNDLSSTDLLRLRRTNITRKSTLPILKIRLKKWFTYIDMIRHRERKPISHL